MRCRTLLFQRAADDPLAKKHDGDSGSGMRFLLSRSEQTGPFCFQQRRNAQFSKATAFYNWVDYSFNFSKVVCVHAFKGLALPHAIRFGEICSRRLRSTHMGQRQSFLRTIVVTVTDKNCIVISPTFCASCVCKTCLCLTGSLFMS